MSQESSQENVEVKEASQEVIPIDHAEGEINLPADKVETSPDAAASEQARQEQLAEIKSTIAAEGTGEKGKKPAVANVAAVPTSEGQKKKAEILAGGGGGSGGGGALWSGVAKGFAALGVLLLAGFSFGLNAMGSLFEKLGKKGGGKGGKASHGGGHAKEHKKQEGGGHAPKQSHGGGGGHH